MEGNLRVYFLENHARLGIKNRERRFVTGTFYAYYHSPGNSSSSKAKQEKSIPHWGKAAMPW
jgi:hypothetical protein